jgi:hypothetical protein
MNFLHFFIPLVIVTYTIGADNVPSTSTEATNGTASGTSEQKETLPFGLKSSMTVDQIKEKLKEKPFLSFVKSENGKYADGIEYVNVTYKAKDFDINGTKIDKVHITIFNSKIYQVDLDSVINFDPSKGAQNLVNLYKFFVESNYETTVNNTDELKTGADLNCDTAVFQLKKSDDDGVFVNIFTTASSTGKWASMQSVFYEVDAVSDELIARRKEMESKKNSDTLDKLK